MPPDSGTPKPAGERRPASFLEGLRHRVGRWLYRGRVRLGTGHGLQPVAAAELEAIRRRFPLSKFFVFGHARSGTSFLARLIRLHPDVHCEWQSQFFSERGPVPYLTSAGFQHWLRHPSDRWTSGWDPTAAFLRVCCDTLLEKGADRAGKRIVGDKSPNENGAEAVEWLAAIYPDARLIYIVRDGRDTVLSKRIQAFIDQPDTLRREDRAIRRALLSDPRPFLERKRSIFTARWLEAAAATWSESVRGSAESGRRLFGDRFALVRYEDLLAEPYEVMDRLWTFLGADAPRQELQASVLAQTQENPEADWHESTSFAFVRELPRGVHGGWRSLFTPEDTERFNRAARVGLEAFGYLHAG
jgi:hypothetical protein